MSIKPIGAIVWALEHKLPTDVDQQPTPQQAAKIQSIYEDFDERYHRREDYKLWRCAIRPHFSIRRRWASGWQTKWSMHWTDWAHLARLCAESLEPVVFWSGVALAPELIVIASRAGEIFETAPIWTFSNRLYGRLVHEVSALSECPASCGIAASVFLMRYQFLHNRAGKRFTSSDIKDLVKALSGWLQIVDPCWSPGEKVNTTALEDERRLENGRLRPGHDAYEFTILVGTLRSVRPFISENATSLDQHSEKLHELAYYFALSAWLTARSSRISLQNFHEQLSKNGRKNERRAQRTEQKAVLTEVKCLFNLTLAARDAARQQEQYLEAARYAYLLLRVIPERFSYDNEILREFKRRGRLFRYIKEAGLEVDVRYDTKGPYAEKAMQIWSSKNILANHRSGREENQTQLGGAVDNGHSVIDRTTYDETGFYLVVERDQQKLSWWSLLLEQIPKGPRETPPGYLLTVLKRLADRGEPATKEALAAAFQVFLRYGFVRSAAKVLSRAVYADEFALTLRHTLDFIHSVRRCMTLEPFGMRYEKVLEWMALATAACDKLRRQDASTANWFVATDVLWIHETLIGRTHTHQRSLDLEGASRLYGKASGIFQFQEIREFYDREYQFLRKPKGVATPSTIARFCEKYTKSTLGAPLMVSVLCFDSFISIVATGRYGKPVARQLEIQKGIIGEAISTMVGEAEFWFRFDSVPLSAEISIPDVIMRLASTICGVATEIDSEARVILLSAEPELIQLPWQYLLNSADFKQNRSASTIVALVPNFSTITIESTQENDVRGVQIVSPTDLEDDSTIRAVKKSVERTALHAESRDFSLCIVVGHGKQPDKRGDVSGVSLGEGRNLESIRDWMGVLWYKHIILHCCHGGSVEPVFMHELGGIPGIGLSLGAEVFIAPITEVSSSAAIVLQEELFRQPSREEVAEGYFRAVARMPAVCLYSLYGNPYARLNLQSRYLDTNGQR